MKYFKYCGPVTSFGIPIALKWKCSTWAVSKKKARSNMAYQFNIDYKRSITNRVGLPGKIVEVLI